MIPRIKSVTPLPDYCLSVSFDDGRRVRYDVKEDFALPGYGVCGMYTGCSSRCSWTKAGRAYSGTKMSICRATPSTSTASRCNHSRLSGRLFVFPPNAA